MRLRHYTATAKEALGMAEDLAALALLELRGAIRSRVKHVLALAISAILFVIGAFFGGVLLLVLAWDTPYRSATVIGLLVVPVVASVCIALQVLHRWRNDRWMTVTRNESREIYTWMKSKL